MVMTNFRAEDMPGAKKTVASFAKKAAAPAPKKAVVEAPVEVIEDVVVEDETEQA